MTTISQAGSGQINAIINLYEIQIRKKIILVHLIYKHIKFIVYGSLDLWIIFLAVDPEASPARTTLLL